MGTQSFRQVRHGFEALQPALMQPHKNLPRSISRFAPERKKFYKLILGERQQVNPLFHLHLYSIIRMRSVELACLAIMRVVKEALGPQFKL
jgi:hypothetical protein